MALSTALTIAIANNVSHALLEDIGEGDITAALVPADEFSQGRVITREPGIFCGKPWVIETARQVDPAMELTWHVDDGDQLKANQLLFEVSGLSRSILTAERTMLNFVQLLSGTATQTAQYVAMLSNSQTKLLDTRKTIPGLRQAQKYAVTQGGGQNHRMGLFDAFLIKENHIAATGSITAAIEAAKELHPNKPVEVETENLNQLDEALAAGADIIMVDEFSLADTSEAVSRAAGRAKIEASGSVNVDTITDIASTGVDYISMGNLTKRVIPLDLSMRFSKAGNEI